MKYFCFVSVLLVSVLLGGGAWAQTATPTPILEYNSLGGTGSLPGAYWTINGNGSVAMSAVQGGLVFTDNNGTNGLANDIYYQGAGVSPDTTSGWTVIVRAKKNSDTAVDRGGQIFCHNSTNAAEGYVGMGLGRRTSGVQRANRIMLHGSENNMSEAYDLSQWHTFRFVVKSGGIPGYTANTCGVFVDELAGQFHSPGSAVLTYDAAGSYFRFGLFTPSRGVQQEVVIDYIKLFGEIMVFATNTPTETPTVAYCGLLANHNFGLGNASYWTVTNVGVNAGSWGIPVPEGLYYAGDAASYGVKSGTAYQVVTGNSDAVCRLEGLCTNWDQRNGSSPVNWVDSCQFQIGLDPAGTAKGGGGTSIPWSANCRWARYQTPRVAGCGSSVTAWFRYVARYGVEWNFAYFDDFCLIGNPAPLNSVDFQAADLYPGPFYSTYNGNNMTCLAQMVTDVTGTVGRGLKMDPTSNNSTTPSRGIGVFLMEGVPSAVGTVSGWMRCPGAAADVGGVNHWMEFAWKSGRFDAYDFDATGTGWTLIQKFDGYSGTPELEGNVDTWTQYQTTTGATDANGEISVGVKLGNGGSGTANYLTNNYWFDEIKLEGALPVNDWMVF